MQKAKLPGVKRQRLALFDPSGSYYCSVVARFYRPHLGDGLPKRGIWRRDGRYIYFRCALCSTINRNVKSTFATKCNALVRSICKVNKTKDVGVLHRCISCWKCRRSVSGTVLLGFKNPEAFLKRRVRKA
jgi:hypothetical protein